MLSHTELKTKHRKTAIDVISYPRAKALFDRRNGGDWLIGSSSALNSCSEVGINIIVTRHEHVLDNTAELYELITV